MNKKSMLDYFCGELRVSGGDASTNGWFIVEKPNGDCLDESGDGGLYQQTAEYVVLAINSYDKYLETISKQDEIIEKLVTLVEHYGNCYNHDLTAYHEYRSAKNILTITRFET